MSIKNMCRSATLPSIRDTKTVCQRAISIKLLCQQASSLSSCSNQQRNSCVLSTKSAAYFQQNRMHAFRILQSHRAIRTRASSLRHGHSGPVELSAFEPSDPVEKQLRTFSKFSCVLSDKSGHRSASYHSHRAIKTRASIQRASGFEPF
jgi:hypothetical protein